MRDERAAAVESALSGIWRDAPAMPTSDGTEQGDPAIRERVEAIWDDIPRLRERESYAALLGEPTWRERFVETWRGALAALASIARKPAFAALAAVLIVAAGAMILRPWSDRAESFATAKAETRLLAFADGSTIALGASSAVEVDYRQGARRATLAAGEAFFSIARDSSRPFTVLAGDTTIEVLGTKFNVNRTPQGIRVSVLEGIVRVRAPRASGDAGPAMVSLRRGEQATAFDQAPIRIVRLAMAEPGGWRSGRLTYEDATLAEIVADANRYYSGRISIVSAQGGRMRLTTSFRTTQIDQFLETVETALPLDVRRAPDGAIVIADRSD